MGATTVPAFLGRSRRWRAGGRFTGGDRVLVVVQLAGGNDGLNTVVPHGLDGYGGIAGRGLPAATLHKVTGEIGSASGSRTTRKAPRQWAARGGAGGGIPEPGSLAFPLDGDLGNRPARNDALETGWLGRALDALPTKAGDDSSSAPHRHPGPFAGRRGGEADRGSGDRPSLDQYSAQARRQRHSERRCWPRRARPDGRGSSGRATTCLLAFLRRSTLTAYDSSKRLEQARFAASTDAKYPEHGLARRLSL